MTCLLESRNAIAAMAIHGQNAGSERRRSDACSVLRQERFRAGCLEPRRDRYAQARPRRGAREAEDLRRQPVRREIPRGPHPQDRISPRHPPQRRRGRHRSGGRGRASIAHRRARLDLERPMEARVRHLRRLHRAARSTRSEDAGSCQLRGRRLPRHSGDDRLSRGRGRGSGEDRAGFRRRWRRRPLRHPVRQGARPSRYRHGQFRGQGQDRARRRAPTTPSTTSARTSASG